jgi:signal transduction histidine kinase
MDLDDRRITGVVRDDGAGFDLRQARRDAALRRRLGLSLMQERARLVGGEITITSWPGAGTTVQVCVPWPATQDPIRATPSHTLVGATRKG